VPDRFKWACRYAVLAGACDAGTGLALLLDPGRVLTWMGMAVPSVEPVYLRYIGAFVLTTGLAYLYPFALSAGRLRQHRLAVIFEVTLLIRFIIALFVLFAIARGLLPAGWISVAATDGVLAGVQGYMLRHRWMGRDTE
jgi:hypothetical protein